MMEQSNVIGTGNPPAVDIGIKPDPIYLENGQTVRACIRGLGEQCQRVAPATE